MPTATRPVVFVVDDESVIAATLAMILQNNGFDARSFTNPLKAIDAARTEPPSLLISDVFMPEMLGTDLAIQMQNTHPTCKVLLFSGQAATAALLEKARALGHNFNLLEKPSIPRTCCGKSADPRNEILSSLRPVGARYPNLFKDAAMHRDPLNGR